MANQNAPKLSGLSFNVYAIVALLVILPITTATITTLASGFDTSEQYDDLIKDSMNPTAPNTNGIAGHNIGFSWVDVGWNMSNDYLLSNPNANNMDCFNEIEAHGWFMPSVPTFPYNDRYNCKYGSIFLTPGLIQQGFTPEYIDGFGALQMSQTHAFITNTNYIGTSGNNFAFSIENSIFNNLDDTLDLSELKISMIDKSTSYDCESSIVQNITFNYDIMFVMKPSDETTHYTNVNYNNLPTYRTGQSFDYSGKNVKYVFSQAFGSNRCYVGFDIIFDFDYVSSFNLASFVDNYGSYENLSAIVEIKNLENPDNFNDRIGSTALPFAGNQQFYISAGAKYVDSSNVNFVMYGGASLLGIGLFALALASTPYWNPVTSNLGRLNK